MELTEARPVAHGNLRVAQVCQNFIVAAACGPALNATIDAMEPRIQYATTADGVSIAFTSMGQGFPLVIPPPAHPWSNFQGELQIPEWRHWYEHLTEVCRIIRYDGRGTGMSDRDVTAISLDSAVQDLEAVVDAAGVDRFALEGFYYAGLTAIAYAANHPERVSHLLLWCAFASNASQRVQSGSQALEKLLDVDYDMFLETMMHQVLGWGEGESAHRLAMMMRDSLSPELAKATWACYEDADITELLPKIQCPTLVMHRRQFQVVNMAQARALVAGIPGARLSVLDGSSLSPFVGDIETPLREMAAFLGLDTTPFEGAMHHEAGQRTGFRTVMFTDIEDSTATTQHVGDAVAQEMVRTHNDVVRRALHRFGGTEVKHTGDGIMASFLSPAASIECAIAIQRQLAAHSLLERNHPMFSVRIGINAGEPVIEGDDLFGTAVQVASRICTRAEPRQILVSDVVRQLVAGKGFLFADRGETELRGFEDPVRLFEVRWNEGISG
jgi:class 3 adenylate cyclase